MLNLKLALDFQEILKKSVFLKLKNNEPHIGFQNTIHDVGKEGIRYMQWSDCVYVAFRSNNVCVMDSYLKLFLI